MNNVLHENYAKAGFGGSLAFGQRPALLIIDVVDAYLKSDSPLYANVETALHSNVRLIECARSARIPVYFTKVTYQAGLGGLDGGVFFRKLPVLKIFEAGSPLGEFPPEIAPQPGEAIIIKQYASAFFGTSLASTLAATGIDTLVIGGFSTSGCVRASAVDALQHGFIPFVVREASGDRDVAVHQANLFDLQAKYAEVISEQDALLKMINCSGNIGQ